MSPEDEGRMKAAVRRRVRYALRDENLFPKRRVQVDLFRSFRKEVLLCPGFFP
jgi:hypothetical protein